MLQDLRYALRQLRKSPAFATVAVLTLALGIGANTAIFTLLDQALLRSLPVSHPEQLVRLRYEGSNTGTMAAFGGDDKDYFSYPMYRDLRDQNQVFSGMLANDELQSVGVQWHGHSELVQGELVSGNYFDVLGVRPAMGRLLLSADDAAQNGNPVVVLSFNYWKSSFGSDPRVINQVLYINGHPFTIVGVVEPNFHSVIAGFTPKLFVPMTTKPIVMPGFNDLEDRRSMWANIVARLKPGVSRQQAEAAMTPLWRSIRASELPQIKHASEQFRKHFVAESKLQLMDESRGFSPLAQPDRSSIAGGDGDGRPGTADGVRERVQPAAGARRLAGERDVGALRHGCLNPADHPATADGRALARAAGRGCRFSVRARRLGLSGAEDCR